MKTWDIEITLYRSFDGTKEEAKAKAREEWLWHESKYDGDQNVFFPNDVHIEEVARSCLPTLNKLYLDKALRSEIKEMYKTVLQNYGDNPKTFSHKDIIRVLNNICEEASLWDSLDSEIKEEYKCEEVEK